MRGSMRLSAALAVAALAAGSAPAQIVVNPAAAAAARGFGGFTGLGAMGAPVLPAGGIGVAGSPYGLSTVASGNPYLGGTLGASPYGVGGYGLSTVGTNLASQYAYSPYGPYFQDPYSGYLQGLAAVQDSTGRYWVNIQQAKLMREQARQAGYETARKRVELEMWYERLRPTTQDIVNNTVRSDLERARKDPPIGEVVSGKSLNDLLNNIQKMGGVSKLSRVSSPSLEEDTLKQINLTAPRAAGSAGLIRDGGKFKWPVSMHERLFDDERERLARNVETAVGQIKDKGAVDVPVMKSIADDMRSLQNKVDNSQDDLTMGQYLEAKAFMRQLAAGVGVLRDPNARKYFDNSYTAKGGTVAELVANMRDKGLSFAPAAPGDEAAYMALYYAIRSYEAGLALAQK